MKNLYVISGLTGMTGNELVRQIIAKGDYVIGFDNFFASSIDTISDVIENDNLEFFEYDILNEEHMRTFESHVAEISDKFERITYINCAAVVHTEYFYEVESTFAANVLGMKSFLEQAIRVGADTYINCSTSEVYSMKSWDNGGVKEEDFISLATAEHSQRTSYAVGKLMTEFFIKDAVDKGRIKGCSIRFANVYSKNERFAKHIIPHIIESLLNDGSVLLLENAKTTKRTFLHNIDSCSSVLALAETSECLDGSVYNVATDEEIGIIDLVELCAEMMDIPSPRIEYSGFRPSDPERRVLNTNKIRSLTGWKPIIDLRSGIQMCINNRKRNK